MAGFQIDFTNDAKIDLTFFTAFERKMILDEVKTQLRHEPATQTRNRKVLRDNPVAPWGLRIGKYRVFYWVDEQTLCVSVAAVGSKEHNVLYIRGEEVRI